MRGKVGLYTTDFAPGLQKNLALFVSACAEIIKTSLYGGFLVNFYVARSTAVPSSSDSVLFFENAFSTTNHISVFMQLSANHLISQPFCINVVVVFICTCISR